MGPVKLARGLSSVAWTKSLTVPPAGPLCVNSRTSPPIFDPAPTGPAAVAAISPETPASMISLVLFILIISVSLLAPARISFPHAAKCLLQAVDQGKSPCFHKHICSTSFVSRNLLLFFGVLKADAGGCLASMRIGGGPVGDLAGWPETPVTCHAYRGLVGCGQ